MADWEENGTIEQGITISFVAVDQDELQQRTRFMSRSHAPDRPPSGELGGLVSGLITAAVLLPTAFFLGEVLPESSAAAARAVMAMVAIAIALAVAYSYWKFTLPAKFLFVIGCTAKEFSVAWGVKRFAVDVLDVDRFEGGARLTLVKNDGARLLLPCWLPGHDHTPFAFRLNGVLRDAKALRQAVVPSPLAHLFLEPITDEPMQGSPGAAPQGSIDEALE